MKKLFYFIILISFTACQDTERIGPSGNVRLSINAKFAGQPLVMKQPYLFGSANQVKFDQFNFFISNVTLLEAATEDETDLMEVGMADFTANTDPGNVQPAYFDFSTVPAVKYRGIKLSIGVPSGLNKSSVKNYGSGHPLKKAFDSHFWSAGNSFFFMKLGGVYDLNGDGTFGSLPEDHPFELYPAKNSNFQTVTLLKTFTLEDGKSLNLNMSLDVLKLLQDAGNQTLDFADPANLSTYNPANDDLSKLLMGNFKTALEFQ